MCKVKKHGGLRVKDLRHVNLAILGKWHRRLPMDNPSLWNDIIDVRYDLSVIRYHLGGWENGSYESFSLVKRCSPS